MSVIEEIGYPVVIKPTVGSWGRLIGLLRDRDVAEAVIESREYMFPLYRIYFFEEFVKRPPRDIRAIVIGNRVDDALYIDTQDTKNGKQTWLLEARLNHAQLPMN